MNRKELGYLGQESSRRSMENAFWFPSVAYRKRQEERDKPIKKKKMSYVKEAGPGEFENS